MHGEWQLSLDVSGPRRDRVTKKLHFGAQGGSGDQAMAGKHRGHMGGHQKDEGHQGQGASDKHGKTE